MEAVIKVKGVGNIVVELYRDYAPITVDNFVKLAKEGFYNGLIFHRVIKGFVIQGGCPKGNGTGGPGYTIKGEFFNNGVNNPIRHTRGAISMARSMSPNSAGSQFFICQKDTPHLDGGYAAFGMTKEGIEVVDAICDLPTDSRDKPLQDVVIESIEIR